MKYKLVIFDMDGTILDTSEDLTNAYNYALKACGYPTKSIDEIIRYVGNGLRKLLEQIVPEGCTDSDIDRLQEIFVPYYQEHSAIKTGPYTGIIQLLKNLKDAGCMLAVASNKPDAAVKKLAADIFPGLFDIAVGENEAGGIKRKPAADEVELILSSLGIAKEDSVYIGDSDVDVATARNSGLDLIAVDWGFRTREFLIEFGAEVICSNTKEVEDIILGCL